MAEEHMIKNEEMEIDLIALFHELWRHILIIILCFIVGLLGSGLVTKFLITPLYQSSAMIYILGNSTSVSGINLQLSKQLTVDYTILATSRPVVNEAIAALDGDYTYGDIVGKAAVENPSGSSILKITVTSADPQEAADIANALAEATSNSVATVMNMDKPTTMEEASVPSSPVSPNLLKNAAMGGIAGVLLACAVIVIRFLLDDTIKTEEDVRKYLDLNTLASIPKERRRKSA